MIHNVRQVIAPQYPPPRPLRVAVVAPPWLALPIKGYGGIELVVEGLVRALQQRDDVEVELFANGARRMRNGTPTHSYYKRELFDTIDDPYYDAPLQALQTHLNFALHAIEADGNFDIIHDHNPYIGPAFFLTSEPYTRITTSVTYLPWATIFYAADYRGGADG